MQDLVLHKIDFLSRNNFPVYGNKIPSRMMYLRNDAWIKLKEACVDLRLFFSDIYRSPASSAEAYARKIGVSKPGYSGHNYGVAIDLDVQTTLKENATTYQHLCEYLIFHGWTPYQGTISPFSRGKEDWHFNFIGSFAKAFGGSSQVENWIQSNIKFETSLVDIQRMLFYLKFYQGEIDGSGGPLTSEAIKKFKRAWLPAKILSLGESDKLDDLTIRTINIVSCRVLDENNNQII